MSKFFWINSRTLPLAAAVTILSLSAGYFTLAWNEPSAALPVSVAAPITTGNAAQSKTGSFSFVSGLTVTSSGQSFALKDSSGNFQFVVGQDGHVGIGTSAPKSRLGLAGATNGEAIGFDPYTYFGSEYSSADLMLGHFVRPRPGAVGYIKSTGIAVNGSSAAEFSADIIFATKGADSDAEGANWDMAANTKMAIRNNGDVNITNNLNVGGNQTVIGNSTVGSLNVIGNSNIGGNQTINGDLTLRGNFNATGTINTSAGLCIGGICVDSTTWNKVVYVATGGGKQKFTSSGTFTVPAGVTTVTLSMCGGGGGGNYGSGYGGAGASCVVSQDVAVTSGSNIAVTVGTGGVGGVGWPGYTPPCGDGGSTSFGSLLSAAGGRGCGGNPGTGSPDGGATGGTGGMGTGSAYGAGGAGGIGGHAWDRGGDGGPGSGYGGGGGGGGGNGRFVSGDGGVGGAGSPGFCLIEW